LSDLAGRLRSLSPDTPERAAYLEKLSAEVEAGRYTVDAQALSRKIIDDALQETRDSILNSQFPSHGNRK
jgi:anti-sigma28 factor (negative regulator of flagellin synthesis)